MDLKLAFVLFFSHFGKGVTNVFYHDLFAKYIGIFKVRTSSVIF